jgi:hypothetical protein
LGIFAPALVLLPPMLIMSNLLANACRAAQLPATLLPMLWSQLLLTVDDQRDSRSLNCCSALAPPTGNTWAWNRDSSREGRPYCDKWPKVSRPYCHISRLGCNGCSSESDDGCAWSAEQDKVDWKMVVLLGRGAGYTGGEMLRCRW